jgi:hypothetical protein
MWKETPMAYFKKRAFVWKDWGKSQQISFMLAKFAVESGT